MKTNAISANYWVTVAQVAGIDVFPTRAGAIGRHPVALEIEWPLDILAVLPARPSSYRQGTAPDRLAGGGLQSRKIPVV